MRWLFRGIGGEEVPCRRRPSKAGGSGGGYKRTSWLGVMSGIVLADVRASMLRDMFVSDPRPTWNRWRPVCPCCYVAWAISNVNECVAVACVLIERGLVRPKFISGMRWGDPRESGTGKNLAAQGTKGPLRWRRQR